MDSLRSLLQENLDRQFRYRRMLKEGATHEEARHILEEPFGPNADDKRRHDLAKGKAIELFAQAADPLHYKFPADLDPQNITSQLQACFQKAGLEIGNIRFRIFQKDRLSKALEFGTDREDDSELFLDSMDMPTQEIWMRHLGYTPAMTTYVGDLSLLKLMIEQITSERSQLKEFSAANSAIAFYDQRALFPLSDDLAFNFAQVFLVPPRQGMLAIMSDQGTLDLDTLS